VEETDDVVNRNPVGTRTPHGRISPARQWQRPGNQLELLSSSKTFRRFSLASWIAREGRIVRVVPMVRLQQLYVLIEWLRETLFKGFHDFI